MNILLVDDHTLFREALRGFLVEGLDCCRFMQASSPEEAFDVVANCGDLDLILLDLDFPESSGLEALPEFRRLAPAAPVAVLSASLKTSDVRYAMQHGAAGYIPKTTSGEDMLAAIRHILEGEIYLPENLANAIAAAGCESVHITARQLEILQLVADGLSNKAIGRALGITEGTVKLHVTSVLKALGADNRTEAVKLATRQGILHAG